jgi:hypothetical protein
LKRYRSTHFDPQPVALFTIELSAAPPLTSF